MVDSFVLVAFAEYSILLVTFGYTGFWAFNIRRALPRLRAFKIYRSQASGTGLVAAVVLGDTIVATVDVTHSFYFFYNVEILIPFYIATILILFNFIDTSTAAALRSDPLMRETLRWTKSRRYLWVIIVVLALTSIVSTSLLPVAIQNNTLVGFLLTTSVFFAAVGIGVVVLPLSALRSGDLNLRLHLKWFGAFLLSVLLFGVVAIFGSSVNFASGTGFTSIIVTTFEASFVTRFAAGYCLYRSTKSLVPLNKPPALRGV
jgi:hypothetical protein